MSDTRSIPGRLLDGCRRGDPASQKEVYARFYGYAMNITLRYAPTREVAAEILNDGFFKVFRHMDRYNPAFPFLSWFRRIMVNTAIDHFRSTRRELDMVQLMAEDYPDYAVNLPDLETEIDTLPVLQQLSPGYRMVFNLYVMEEYSHEEIADILGITTSASRSNLARAKNRLRELILEQTRSRLKQS